ncbi:MAG: PQQ-dependent sugar dehydrogenase [Paracoccus sp. (in: a-proteobacteria)]|uniref:PQQ-dependent sugar dehydrogenase n=1 Tax=unclassified Paracoccus (in: a-proteobacteria) TaxID=2688777 RepID=UPI000C53FA93|nr:MULTISPECIES: sorbosone dehydrogenase family protein [unclassified Paracoccus (in: a-proteobacteria)]MBA48703.1 sorbosone dehydrogenase [Paracoccus sp. (in: a-proteobacteria)]|tara:strand:+ start:7910 stop:9199 length:1290 start_codon:yes stop_codon:yes gene_type:complete
MDWMARATSIVGGAMVLLRRGAAPKSQATGQSPTIPEARKQGIMTLKMPTAKGWVGDHKPTAAPGLKVNAFARDLIHPRWIEVLPNGDVLVAEALQEESPPRKLMDHAMQATMRRAKAIGQSPNRITLWRDGDGDGVAETRHVFVQNQNQPFGMAMVDGTFYVGNTDGIVAFDYTEGADRLQGPGRKLVDFKPGGHWTRSLIVSPDHSRIYAGVGSLTNIGDEGLEAEEGRAAIWELDLASGKARIFASGLRNPVGMAWQPDTATLWTVVNERDGLGDETPPDYLTSVQEGGFYGWPYCYWDRIVDDRVPQDPDLVARAIKPDYALGGHTASLGLCWMPDQTLPGFGEGMVIGQHGSWNRSTLSGYRMIFVPFAEGRPSGPPRDILWGFLSEDEKFSYGRPVGVAIGPDRRSLLMADDVGDVIWRVSAA